MKDVKVFNEVAFANEDKNGNRYLNLKLRQSMDNDKGGNAYLASTFNQEGKVSHFTRIGMDKAKSGPNEGKSEFERLAAAAGWNAVLVKNVENEFDRVVNNESGKERIVHALDNQALTVQGYPSKEDLENKVSQTVYYRDYKHQITNNMLKTKDGYVENPEKRSAHFGKIEDTVTPYPDFDPDVNAQKVAQRKELMQAAKLADKLQQPQAAAAGNAKQGPEVDMGDIL